MNFRWEAILVNCQLVNNDHVNSRTPIELHDNSCIFLITLAVCSINRTIGLGQVMLFYVVLLNCLTHIVCVVLIKS